MPAEAEQFVLDYLSASLLSSAFAPHASELLALVCASGTLRHGDLPRWLAAVQSLPISAAQPLQADHDAVRVAADIGDGGAEALKALMPWRKGPWRIGDVTIDSEWRCDKKWRRIADHLTPLAGRSVLDVGGGNGYYAWRMHSAGASNVMNIDPTLLFLMQFMAVDQLVDCPDVVMLPMTLEQLPAIISFDSVFSMGVLYHRRDPISHLRELADQLRPGGELILETLVVPGDADTCLVPDGRYARMRNVWFLPSVPLLQRWLTRNGFHSVRTIDASYTTVTEQRATAWMTFDSLADALSTDGMTTIEGHPPPLRATLIATRD